jgi:hypothetical protein
VLIRFLLGDDRLSLLSPFSVSPNRVQFDLLYHHHPVHPSSDIIALIRLYVEIAAHSIR